MTKYESELETLILETLLPTYIKYQTSLGNKNPLYGINESLVRQIKSHKRLPALFRPKTDTNPS